MKPSLEPSTMSAPTWIRVTTSLLVIQSWANAFTSPALVQRTTTTISSRTQRELYPTESSWNKCQQTTTKSRTWRLQQQKRRKQQPPYKLASSESSDNNELTNDNSNNDEPKMQPEPTSPEMESPWDRVLDPTPPDISNIADQLPVDNSEAGDAEDDKAFGRGSGGVLVDQMDWRDLAASRFDRPDSPGYYQIQSMERHFPLNKARPGMNRSQREPTGLAEIKAKEAEVLPPNKGRIMYSPYIPPQGEAYKENIFGEAPPELITIDAFDILIQLRAEVGLYFRDTLMEATGYNARLTRPEFFTAAYERAFAEVWEEMPCFGVKHGLTAKEWWHAVTKRTYDYAPLTEPGLRKELEEWLLDEVFDVLYHDVFMTQEAWELRDGVIEALSFLKKWRDEDSEDSPRALAILSNYDERLHAILDELDILDVFDFCLTAREIGVAMPDRSAFQVAMARCGITDPKRCMHITADVDGGLVGASLAEWHAVYCPADDTLDLPEGLDERLIFSQLRDLFGVLRIWKREPRHRLISTTTPILEQGTCNFCSLISLFGSWKIAAHDCAEHFCTFRN